MKPISDARTCKDRRTYLQGRMHVLAWRVARTCEDGCSTLRGGMQCTAWTVAVHCGSGCSALRERLQCTASEMGKGAQKSLVLFWIREKGDKTHI